MNEAIERLRKLASFAGAWGIGSADARAILTHIDSLTAELAAAKEAEIARLQDVLQHIGTVGTCDPFSSDPAKSCFHIARAALKGADHGRD